MMKITKMTVRIGFITAALVLFLAGFLAKPDRTRADELPLQHPRETGDLRRCSDCHETEAEGFPYRRYEHTPLFGEKHGLAAVGSQRLCEICHQPSFCSDCHGAGAGLKPSIKNHGDTRRRMPHRGDYLTRHRIDGHLNPAACFSCHGRPKAARTCAPCHG